MDTTQLTLTAIGRFYRLSKIVINTNQERKQVNDTYIAEAKSSPPELLMAVKSSWIVRDGMGSRFLNTKILAATKKPDGEADF